MFTVDERDIKFTLFEHLQCEELFNNPRYEGFERDDAEMILGEAHRLAKDDIYATRAEGDREGCTYKDGSVHAPSAFGPLLKKYADGGWIALNASEDLGGSAVPLPVTVGCAEAMVGANIAFSMYPGLARGVARVVDNFGSEWLRQNVAKRLFAGDWMASMCLTEAHAGTAVGDLKTTAVKNGRNYKLKGNKIFITAGEHDLSENIIHLVLARTPDAPLGIKGLSLFVVPKFHMTDEGAIGERNDVVCTGIEEKMGLHGSATCVLSFGDDNACEAILVGEEGAGITYMFQLMNEARIGTGLQGLAAASAAFEIARDYAHERVQGVKLKDMRDVEARRVPIVEHPDVKRMLFTMKAEIEGMRALLYKASTYGDQSRTHADEAVRKKNQALLEIMTPICKAHCTDVGFDMTVMGLQVLGGYGYVRESGIEQLVRDTKVSSIYEGTNGVQALDLVGRKLGRNNGESFMLLMDEISTSLNAVREHPTLGDLASGVADAQTKVREITGLIAQAGMGGDYDTPALVAREFLTMLAQVIIGWLLVEQSVVAHDRLSELCLDANVTSNAEREALLDRSSDAVFYDNKLHTAAFFVKNLLPRNLALAASIEGGHRGIMGARL